LSLAIDGGPGILFDPTCTHLINAMGWGYRFRKSVEGIITTLVEKNLHSYIAEAAEYAATFYTGVAALGGRYSMRPPARPVRPVNRFVYS
jgi:hypothetical protein